MGALVRYTPNPGFDEVHSFTYVVSDGRGGSDSGTVAVTVQNDATPPTITATASPPSNANGWNDSDVTVSFTCEDQESGILSCPDPVNVTTEGANQTISGEAFDRAGNSASASVMVNLDKTSPSVTLSGPSTGRRGQTVVVTAPGSDNLALDAVIVSVDGVDVATLTGPPFQTNVTIPSTATVGSVLSITATARDLAGNAASAAPLSIEVLGGGFVSGEVYDDTKGLPLAGVTVSVNAQSVTTDPRGRFGLFTTDSLVQVRAVRSGFTTVERVTTVDQASGTVVFDLRLTPLAGTTLIGASGGVLSSANFTLTVPPNALTAETPMRLTEVSGLGLKNVLPFGWSPLGSVDVQPSGTSLAGSTLRIASPGLTGLSVVLVRYDDSSNAWVVESAGLTGDSFVEATIDETGAYAFLVPDTGSTVPPNPVVGEPLEGVEPVLVFFGLSASSEVTPAVSPVSPEAKATGSVVLFSPIELPSGTLVSARVEETFESFGEGTLVSEPFAQEMPVYRFPVRSDEELHQEFPVTPSRAFTLEELREGRIHVEIGTAPSLQRGSLVGEEGQVVSGGDGTELTIPGGALPETVSVSVEGRDPLEVGVGFEGLSLVAAAEVELSGRTLSTPGTLSVPVSLTSSQNLFAARFLFVAGQRKLRLLGPASYANGRISTSVETGGTYLFFQSSAPLALVQGTVIEGGLPARLVLVESSTSPFMDITPDSGFYVVAAKLDATTITARSLVTGNQTVETLTPTSTVTIPLDLVLATTGPFVAEVTPPNGALGVSLSPPIRVTFSEPVDPSSVTTSSFSLASTAPVPGRIVLGLGNRSVSFLPDANLEPVTSYTFRASENILDTSGNPLLPFTSSFRTLDDSTPELNPDALTVSFPDGNGFVTVSAPEFSFEGNAAVTIVNLTNGIVVTGNVNPDGSLLFQIRASITDELQVRVLDSSDRELVIEKTEFVGPNGEVAIGRKGGKITNGDFVVEVPEGALAGASVLTLTPVDQAVLDALPLPDGAGGFGSGVEVNTGGAFLTKEGDLSFPIPVSAPADAQHVIVRRVAEDGLDTYEVIDTASVVEGKVKTESPPFYGFLVSGMYLNLWVPPTPAGKNPMGAITGIVQESDLSATQSKTVPVAGAKVRRETRQAGDLEALTNQDGRFVILDRFFGEVGPTIPLVAKHPKTGEEVSAIAFESTDILSQFASLTRFSRAGEVVFNFPLSPPPPPPTEVTILLFRKNGEARVAIMNGFAAVGDELIIKVQFTQPPENVSVSVNGQNVAVSRKDDERVNDQTLFVFEGTFTPQEPRSYTIVAEGLDAFRNVLTARKSFLAAQGGAGNEERLEGPPSIISDSAVPRNGDTGVPVTQVMSVQFTEPVTNVFSGTVTFEELGESPSAIGLDILGTKVGGAVAPVTFTDEIVALTMTPQRGLKFATKYRLTFSTTIRDTDLSPTGQPAPKFLSAETNVIEFETFEPTKLGEAPLQGSLVAMTTLDNLAFVALQPPDANGLTGNLQVFDLSDPTQPTKTGEDSIFIGSMVRDVDVEKEADGGSDVLGVLSFNPRSGNSGLTLFDVTSRQSPFPYAGFVTTVVPGEGADFQVDLHEGFAYVAIGTGGLKIVNLEEAKELFRAKLQDKTTPPVGLGSIPFDVQRGLSTRGVGFGQQAVQNHLQIPDTSGSLRVSAIQVEGTDLDRVGYVGSLSDIDQIGRFSTIGLANTPAASIIATVQLKTLPDPEGNTVHMSFPSDVAITDIDADKYAVVVGGPMAPNGPGTLAILKVTDPDTPQLLTVIELRGGWGTNLAIDEDGVTAFVSTADRKEGGTTIPGGVEIYNLANPAAALFAGKMEGFGAGSGGLSLVQGILTAATSSAGVQTATVGPAVALLTLEPKLLPLDNSGITLKDLTLRHGVVPNVRGVRSARIEIRDEAGAVLFETAVPLTDRGEVVWPKGQTLRPTPREIVFELRNSDGSVSNTASATAVSPIASPVLSELSPSRVEVGSGSFDVIPSGRNFTTISQVAVMSTLPEAEPLVLSTTFVSTTEIHSTIPSELVSREDLLLVAVKSGAQMSNVLSIRVVPAGLPRAPVLSSITPEQVVAGAGHSSMTLTGDFFLQGNSLVKLDVAGDPLLTEYVSANELRATVPSGFLTEAGRIALRVEDAFDPDLVSESRTLEILPFAGSAPLPIAPAILSVSPSEVPYVAPDGPETVPVKLSGQGFQAGATVFARFDDSEFVPLQTSVTSSTEVEVAIPKEKWAKHRLNAFHVIETTEGVVVASATAEQQKPTIAFRKSTKGIEPSIFFDPGRKENKGYLVELDSGTELKGNAAVRLFRALLGMEPPQSDSFRNNPQGVQLEVIDPNDPELQDVSVQLISLDASGGSLNAFDVRMLENGNRKKAGSASAAPQPDFDMGFRKIVAVMDQQDNSTAFSADEGKDTDPTIRASIGGKLEAVYIDKTTGSVLDRVDDTVCTLDLRRKVKLHLVNLEGSGWTEAAIRKAVEEAALIWAQVCVEFEVLSFTSITGAAPNELDPLDLKPFQSVLTSPDGKTTQRINTHMISSDVRAVIEKRPFADRLLSARNGEISLYFIRQFFSPTGPPTLTPCPSPSRANAAPSSLITGVAYTYTRHVKDYCAPSPQLEDHENLGLALIAAPTQANSRTLAHELAHIIISNDHVSDAVSVLSESNVVPTSFFKKRFTTEFVSVIRDNHFARPLP